MEIIASTIFGRSSFNFGRSRMIRFPPGRRVIHQTGFTNTPYDTFALRRKAFYEPFLIELSAFQFVLRRRQKIAN